MKTREEHIEFDRSYCEHYAPQPGLSDQDNCALGCGASQRMKEAREAGAPAMSPCIGGHNTNAIELCSKWERRSLERAEKRADAIEEAMERMATVMPVVAKWRTWTKDNRVSKQGTIECPKCKGVLHLSQAAYNGHVHGKCETEGCVSWME